MSDSVRRLSGRNRARRLNITSVGVFRRDRVREKMFGSGACGLKGRLRRRKKTMPPNRMFRARPGAAGRDRGGGRLAIDTRRLR